MRKGKWNRAGGCSLRLAAGGRASLLARAEQRQRPCRQDRSRQEGGGCRLDPLSPPHPTLTPTSRCRTPPACGPGQCRCRWGSGLQGRGCRGRRSHGLLGGWPGPPHAAGVPHMCRWQGSSRRRASATAAGRGSAAAAAGGTCGHCVEHLGQRLATLQVLLQQLRAGRQVGKKGNCPGGLQAIILFLPACCSKEQAMHLPATTHPFTPPSIPPPTPTRSSSPGSMPAPSVGTGRTCVPRGASWHSSSCG